MFGTIKQSANLKRKSLLTTQEKKEEILTYKHIETDIKNLEPIMKEFHLHSVKGAPYYSNREETIIAWIKNPNSINGNGLHIYCEFSSELILVKNFLNINL